MYDCARKSEDASGHEGGREYARACGRGSAWPLLKTSTRVFEAEGVGLVIDGEGASGMGCLEKEKAGWGAGGGAVTVADDPCTEPEGAGAEPGGVGADVGMDVDVGMGAAVAEAYSAFQRQVLVSCLDFWEMYSWAMVGMRESSVVFGQGSVSGNG